MPASFGERAEVAWSPDNSLRKEKQCSSSVGQLVIKFYFPYELLFVGAPSPTVPNELEQRVSYAFGVRTSCGAATLIFSSLLTSFGTRGSQVQVLPLRPNTPKGLERSEQPGNLRPPIRPPKRHLS